MKNIFWTYYIIPLCVLCGTMFRSYMCYLYLIFICTGILWLLLIDIDRERRLNIIKKHKDNILFYNQLKFINHNILNIVSLISHLILIIIPIYILHNRKYSIKLQDIFINGLLCIILIGFYKLSIYPTTIREFYIL